MKKKKSKYRYISTKSVPNLRITSKWSVGKLIKGKIWRDAFFPTRDTLVTAEVKQNGEKLYANIRSSLLLFSKGDEFTVENMSITCRYPYPRATLWLTSFRICSRIRVHVCLALLLTRYSHCLSLDTRSLFPTIQIASRRVYNTAYRHDYSSFCYWTTEREREIAESYCLNYFSRRHLDVASIGFSAHECKLTRVDTRN